MRFDGLATFARWGRVAVWCSAAAWILSGSAALAQSRLEELEAELKARLRAAGVGREDPPAVAPPITPANTDQAGYLGVIADDRNETRGVRVLDVVEGGPGAQAGLRKNDLLTTMDGRPLTSMQQLSQAVDTSVPGQQMTFELVRDNKTLQRLVTLGRRPPVGQRRFDEFGRIPDAPVADAGGAARRPMLGVRTQTVKEEDRTRLRLPSTMGALVVSVTPDSPASEAGLAPDDVIVAVDGYVVNRPSDLTENVQKLGSGKDVLVSYYRAGRFSRSRALLTGGNAPARAVAADPAAPIATDELPFPQDDLARTEVQKPVAPVQNGAVDSVGDKQRIELLENLVSELLNRVELLEQELKSEREKNGSDRAEPASAPAARPAPRGENAVPNGGGAPGEIILNPAST